MSMINEVYIPKRFIDLKLNDVIWEVSINSALLKDGREPNYSPDFISEIKVESLSIDKNGNLEINKKINDSYSNRTVYYTILPDELDMNCSIHDSESKSRIFFSDKNIIQKFVSDRICLEIQKSEDSIPRYIESQNQRIKRLREKYFDFLNPSIKS